MSASTVDESACSTRHPNGKLLGHKVVADGGDALVHEGSLDGGEAALADRDGARWRVCSRASRLRNAPKWHQPCTARRQVKPWWEGTRDGTACKSAEEGKG